MTASAQNNHRISLGGPLTPIVRILLIITVSAYFLASLSTVPAARIFDLLGLTPAITFGQRALWQLITYPFLHDLGFLHLLFNMLVLWGFGPELERTWGSRLFLRFYFGAAIFAGLTVCLAAYSGFSAPNTTTIGSSGVMMALMTAYAFHFPNRQILFMFILPLRTVYFVALLIGLEVWTTLTGAQDNISHYAHFGGLIFGFLWCLYFSNRINLRALRRLWRRRRMRTKLRLVSSDRSEDRKSVSASQNPTLH